MAIRRGPVPETIRRLGDQLQQFRIEQPRGAKLPASLWQAAVEEARQHGVYYVSHALRLNYCHLKKRVSDTFLAPPMSPEEGKATGSARSPRQRSSPDVRKAAPPGFVELLTGAELEGQEYVIEFESDAGAQMRVRWRGRTPDWSSLLRAWREGMA